ncbi:MAG: beta-glucuronidase [Butyrivibrio sp.]|uniref:beta-glucuronidase n=1 Tax=Butyrivibrio sp. TaxID=28121 RepID=UPI001B280798|nr:beta-glucuronidase [Butyrivibrio sp.]MBO6242693.1 beta-glucuronidase [Butyrivibrio sp.]
MLYQTNTISRTVMSLDGVWKFKADNGKGFEEKWYEKKLDDALNMPVPSSYNDITENPELKEHYGFVFYQRMVSVPRSFRGQRIILRMDAVTHSAIVYLNGEEICRHKGGFLPFEIEVTEMVKEENLLTIAVDNRISNETLPVGEDSSAVSAMIGGVSHMTEAVKKRNTPKFDFFNYCGITRSVKLYTTPFNYIKDIEVTSDVDFGQHSAELRYHIFTEGSGDCSIRVIDREGTEVASSTGTEGTVELKDVNLWEPGKSYLYTIKVTFDEDEYELPYGVRTVEVVGKQFLINNKPFYFKGYGKHEDTFPAGRGINIPMNCKDISLMKWQKANSFRTSHYPYSEEMMRLCDEEGIVVIDECPAVGIHLNFGGGANFKNGAKVNTFDPPEKGGIRTFEHHKDVIRDMINRDKNHACVVMWSIANEPDSAGEGAYEYFAPLFELARKSDPQSRPCTMVTMQVDDNTRDCSLRLSDVFCLNRYYGWYVCGGDLETAEVLMRKELDFWKAQDKPFMFTEYGADTVMGLRDTIPTMFTEEYQVEYYKMNHRVMDSYKELIGEQVWNFADFATSQGIIRVQGNKKGIFTRDRKPKMVAHYLKERWEKIPDFDYKK